MLQSIQATPQGDRLHIAIFGIRNAGKSSLINAITNQEIALVSSVPGTTTDPVYKAMELLPLGPVVLIDTAGMDDEGELGRLRTEKTAEVMKKTDVALLVIDGARGVGQWEKELLAKLVERKIPVVPVANKADVFNKESLAVFEQALGMPVLPVSARTGEGILELKLEIIKKAPEEWFNSKIIGDLLTKEDLVVLVVPIDAAAPKGRLILPQVQTIRDILDNDCMTLVTKETDLAAALKKLKEEPKMVVTDSQAFADVSKVVPLSVPLTSFSILIARQKGDLAELVRGAAAVRNLRPGDYVLISEACTHHRQEDDIGTFKIPRWLEKMVGGKLNYEWTSGTKFPKDLSKYKLIIHCGGCMINRREMLYRIESAKGAQVPITNYGVFIALATGILKRVLTPFPEALKVLDGKTS